MKVLLMIFILFLIVPLKSYSKTNDWEILESKGFRITNPPSDEDFWYKDENLKWRASFIKSEATVELLISNTKTNFESLQNFERALDEFINTTNTETLTSLRAAEVTTKIVTDCLLRYGDPVRVIGASEDDSMILAGGHEVIPLGPNRCEEFDYFALPREALGKPSERGVDTSDIGLTVYYNKNFQWVKIQRTSWWSQFEWVDNPSTLFDVQKKRVTCGIDYGESVKLLRISDDGLLAFVESQHHGGGSSCGAKDHFHLPTASIGKLIHYF